jgi:hypothetical protein
MHSGPSSMVSEYSASAHVVGVTAPLERLLRDLPFEEVTALLLRLVPLAERLGLSRSDWLPTFLVAEKETGRFGLCLDHPAHPTPGAGEKALRAAMTALIAAAPEPEADVRYVLWEDMAGAPYAAHPTFRLRTEHWRWLGHAWLASLGAALRPLDAGPSPLPASRLLGRVWRAPHRNPLREFADAQSPDDLAAFAREVVHGPDALHLRVAFVLHLSALRQVRLDGVGVRAKYEAMLDVLESEVVGEYHLDGQAAFRCLREARWSEPLEALDP